MRNKYPTLILIGIALVIILSAGILIYYEGVRAGVNSPSRISDDPGYDNGYMDGYDAARQEIESKLQNQYGDDFTLFW